VALAQHVQELSRYRSDFFGKLRQILGSIVGLQGQIPAGIPWVLRVDGHTDVRPIVFSQFKSNWDLSAARAISVVQYLIVMGVKPSRRTCSLIRPQQSALAGTAYGTE
jgi:chemotaxis protein MotB